MLRFRHLFLLSSLLLLAVGCRADVTKVSVVAAADKSVAITAPGYTAAIDAAGNFTLSLKGVRALGHKFGEPGKPPAEAPSVTVTNNMVAVRSGRARIEYTFLDDSIKVLTEGYQYEGQLDANVRSLIAPGGKGGPYVKANYLPDTTAYVLTNNLTVTYSVNFHIGNDRFVPSSYCSGSKKFGDLLEFELKVGAPADALQLLSGLTIRAEGSDTAPLLKDGNRGYGVTHFPDPAKIVFFSKQKNLSDTAFNFTYKLVVQDHYRGLGKDVVTQPKDVTLAAGEEKEVRWDIPKLDPGFYYLVISVLKGAEKITDTKLTFTVDLPNYMHPTTRPADFTEFWARQNRLLTETPIAPALTLVSTADNANKAYTLTMDMPGGWKLSGLLIVPDKPGKGPSTLSARIPDQIRPMIEAAKAANWVPSEKSVTIYVLLPEEGRFTRWEAKDNNNLLQCQLCYLRGADYLASRPDVNPKRIIVQGASRGGPLAFNTAALRPHNICGVDSFIHTSAGLSWQDKPYYAWGVPGDYDPKDPAKVKRIAEMAAYVDPVNLAQDVKCPVIFAWGLDDDLAPPQGIEMMFKLTASQWKRISRDAGGHQFSDGFAAIQKELYTLLDSEQIDADNPMIRDH